jgi:hypothetical protein
MKSSGYIIGVLFNRAKHSHEQKFQQSGKAINDKVRLFSRIGDAQVETNELGRSLHRY